MKKQKLVYIVSEVDRSLHFEWITPFLKRQFQLSFLLLGKPDSFLEKFLKNEQVPVCNIEYVRKFDLVKAWFKVFWVLFKARPAIVHTHLWKANLTGLSAAWLVGVKKRIYTRHHASIHYKIYPSGLKWDKLNNRLATHIIAISKNVEHLLVNLDKADRKKVRLIYHGFEFPYFQDAESTRKNPLYEKYNISPENHPVIGVIARLTEWKGVHYIIRAFKNVRSCFPTAHLVLANAHGDYEHVIDHLLADLPTSSFTKINFENDLAALYHLFDIFVHVPVDEDSEAFGQTYIEPLIVGIPCVFTLSGIAREFIVHGRNAMVVDFENEEQICAAIIRLLEDPVMAQKLLENGRNDLGRFTMDRYLTELNELYLE